MYEMKLNEMKWNSLYRLGSKDPRDKCSPEKPKVEELQYGADGWRLAMEWQGQDEGKWKGDGAQWNSENWVQ